MLEKSGFFKVDSFKEVFCSTSVVEEDGVMLWLYKVVSISSSTHLLLQSRHSRSITSYVTTRSCIANILLTSTTTQLC